MCPHYAESIALVRPDHLVYILSNVRSRDRVKIAYLLARMRPDLLTTILELLANIGL